MSAPPVVSPSPTANDIYDIARNGFAAHLEAFAREPESGGYRFWTLSLVGGATAVRAVWANLIEGQLATIRRADQALGWNHRLPRGGIRWQSYQAPLPAAGALHLLALPDRAACVGATPDFVLLVRPQDDVGALFYRYLHRRVRLPLHPSWAGPLWRRAQAAGEVVELEGFGCRAFRCQPDEEQLAASVSAAVAAGDWRVPESAGEAVPCPGLIA